MFIGDRTTASSSLAGAGPVSTHQQTLYIGHTTSKVYLYNNLQTCKTITADSCTQVLAANSNKKATIETSFSGCQMRKSPT